MARWIGSTIGVSLLVVVLGTATGVGASPHNFSRAWYWAAVHLVIGALFCHGTTHRPVGALRTVNATE